MLRFLVVALAVLLLVGLIRRPAAARRTLWVMLALAVVYTALKLTGVIEEMAPARYGVF